MKAHLVVPLTSILLFAGVPRGGAHDTDVGNANAITQSHLRAYLEYIASDQLRGRDTPSAGLDSAAAYIARHLASWGFEPGGGDRSFFQRIRTRRDVVVPDSSSVVVNGLRFRSGDGFIAKPIAGSVSGPLVYVGHGYVVRKKKIDPYEGIDVRGKIIVFSGGRPGGVTTRDFPKQGKGIIWDTPDSYATRHGAAGLIEIPTVATVAEWGKKALDAEHVGTVSFPGIEDSLDGKIPHVIASSEFLEVLLKHEPDSVEAVLGHGVVGEEVGPFAFTRTTHVTMSIAVRSTNAWTQNVIGVYRGANPKFANEYVALGAHYDHLGVGAPVNGDSIYNGADDDGSGTASLLAMAEAVSQGKRPQRSWLFVWHTGEEKGELGSKFFIRYPTIPLDRIIAELNIDMIGRSTTDSTKRLLSGPREIFVIGSKAMSTELGKLSDSTNASYLNLKFNFHFDNTADPYRLFFRSDHFQYAHTGIPIIFYFDGLHPDYHKPSDSVDKIDFAKMELVSRTIFATAWQISQLPRKPLVDLVLPEIWLEY